MGVEGSFRLLHPRLREVIVRYGYSRPTPVQERVIPLVLRGYDVLVVAPTGFGKTEAALFPVFSVLLGSRVRGVGAVYVTPLRSLNRDIFARMHSIARDVGLRLVVRHGDSGRVERRRFLEELADVVITTPESFGFLLSLDRFRRGIEGLRFLIVDEVHELYSGKRGVEFSLVLESLSRYYVRGRFQLVGLSATVSDPDDFAGRLGSWRRVVVVDVGGVKRASIVVDVVPEGGSRAGVVAGYVGSVGGQVIVFTNTRDMAETLGLELRGLMGEDKVAVHHGSLGADVRVSAEGGLKSGRLKAVVATSSLELGIDVGAIELVVQYRSPRQAVKLAQRMGRAGHSVDGVSRAVIVAERNLFDVLESAVLAARTLRGNLEDAFFHCCAYDALLHRVAGLVVERGSIGVDEVYSLALRSRFYSGITADEVYRLLEFASSIGLFRVRGGVVRPGRRLLKYYFSTTMIPDTFQYRVVDVERASSIGVLDEEFAATLERGSVFVLSGRLWEVVDVDVGVVRVREYQRPDMVLPSWEGDLIPVDYKVAREVASVLRRFEAEGESVLSLYPLGERARRFVADVLARHMESFPLPHDRRVVVEHYSDTFIVYSFLGTRANKAFELLLSEYVREVSGYAPRTASMQYAVLVKLPVRLSVEAVKSIIDGIASLDPHTVRMMVERAAVRSPTYRWILLQVAQRMGVIDPRDARGKPVSVQGLLKALSNTPVGAEALREMMTRKVDVKPLLDMLSAIREGRVSVRVVGSTRPSPLAMSVFEEARVGGRESDGTLPGRLLAEIVKRRLQSTRLKLLCVNCGFVFEASIGALGEKPSCPRCGSLMLAPIYESEADLKRLIAKAKKGAKLSRRERNAIRELYERAGLVADHGRKALEALASRGVGVSVARQVLKKLKFGEEAFYSAIVEAEARYYRYRRSLR
ncbi:MAG: hypothetical protein DSY37_03475 [Hyperthermus sp.]|nr:MAG: hypothetical protein DSY37_03475 [Hyperthermus sp.]